MQSSDAMDLISRARLLLVLFPCSLLGLGFTELLRRHGSGLQWEGLRPELHARGEA